MCVNVVFWRKHHRRTWTRSMVSRLDDRQGLDWRGIETAPLTLYAWDTRASTARITMHVCMGERGGSAVAGKASKRLAAWPDDDVRWRTCRGVAHWCRGVAHWSSYYRQGKTFRRYTVGKPEKILFLLLIVGK